MKPLGFFRRVEEFHLELWRDERGGISIKPFVAWLCIWVLCITLLISMFVDFKFNDNLINSIMMIAMVGLGADTADKFSFKHKEPTTEEKDTT
jgi:hypothetical protein